MTQPSFIRFADDQEAKNLMRKLAQDLTSAAFLLGNGVLPTIAIEDDGHFFDLSNATWQTTWTGISFHLFLDLRFPDLGLKYRFLLDLVRDEDADGVEVGEEVQYGKDYGNYRVVGDEEHAKILEMYLSGQSMADVGKQLDRGPSTIFGQIRAHNQAIDRAGFCTRCERVKSEAATKSAGKAVEAEVKNA
jgi:hypothetical protein